jgi:hypothetical protein
MRSMTRGEARVAGGRVLRRRCRLRPAVREGRLACDVKLLVPRHLGGSLAPGIGSSSRDLAEAISKHDPTIRC